MNGQHGILWAAISLVVLSMLCVPQTSCQTRPQPRDVKAEDYVICSDIGEFKLDYKEVKDEGGLVFRKYPYGSSPVCHTCPGPSIYATYRSTADPKQKVSVEVVSHKYDAEAERKWLRQDVAIWAFFCWKSGTVFIDVAEIEGQTVLIMASAREERGKWRCVVWTTPSSDTVMLEVSGFAPGKLPDVVISAYLKRYPGNLSRKMIDRTEADMIKQEIERCVDYVCASLPDYEEQWAPYMVANFAHVDMEAPLSTFGPYDTAKAKKIILDWWPKHKDESPKEWFLQAVDHYVADLGSEDKLKRRNAEFQLHLLLPRLRLPQETAAKDEDWPAVAQAWKEWWTKSRNLPGWLWRSSAIELQLAWIRKQSVTDANFREVNSHCYDVQSMFGDNVRAPTYRPYGVDSVNREIAWIEDWWKENKETFEASGKKIEADSERTIVQLSAREREKQEAERREKESPPK